MGIFIDACALRMDLVLRHVVATHKIIAGLFHLLVGMTHYFERERIFKAYLGFQPVVVLFKPESVEVRKQTGMLSDSKRMSLHLSELVRLYFCFR